MELVKRDIVHTIRVNGDDIIELGALLEGMDRLRLSHPDVWTAFLRDGNDTFARLVSLID
jgi:hypothetical protein